LIILKKIRSSSTKHCEGNRKISRRAGFTLLEMLIAFSILTVVILVSYSMIASGMRVYRLNQVLIQNQSTGRLALMQITRDLRRIDTNYPEDSIRFEADGATGEKRLWIGETLVYHLQPSTSVLTRIYTPTEGVQEKIYIDDIMDLEVAFTSDESRAVEIEIQNKNDEKRIKTRVTFRE
jgi:prepilin-type N-terminal cleavage/methylation domain-containing protein